MESILTSIKKMLGITEEYTHFDPDIVMHINSVFMILTQLGVGPKEGFIIEDSATTWFDFIPDAAPIKVEAVKSYIYLKVKLMFDPPSKTDVVERQISELEWRMNVLVDH